MEDFVMTEETISEQEPMIDFPEETIPEFSLKVKYNGEEQELTREQAVVYAQKGMNYDHVKEQLEKLKKAPQNDLSESRFEELRNEIDSIRARELASRKWDEFRKNHAEYTNYSSLPEEVRLRIAQGMELDAAYALYENDQLKTKLAQIEQNLKNKESAPGSLGSSGTGESADDFLMGFLGM